MGGPGGALGWHAMQSIQCQFVVQRVTSHQPAHMQRALGTRSAASTSQRQSGFISLLTLRHVAHALAAGGERRAGGRATRRSCTSSPSAWPAAKRQEATARGTPRREPVGRMEYIHVHVQVYKYKYKYKYMRPECNNDSVTNIAERNMLTQVRETASPRGKIKTLRDAKLTINMCEA